MLHQFTEKKFMADCPHTIGVEFGTRIIEVSGQKSNCKFGIQQDRRGLELSHEATTEELQEHLWCMILLEEVHITT